MKKIKALPLFFELNQPFRKHLGLIPNTLLKKLDKVYNCLGSSNPKKIRPCIFWKEAETGYYKLVFLTASYISPLKIDLSLCFQKQKICSKFPFYNTSYVISPLGKPLCISLKSPEDLLSDFIYCGSCEDLEILDTLIVNHFYSSSDTTKR
ncbi:hypothetical protein F1847_08145 [Thermodesulfobacterium sp. TA1]|uniref:hypothetical protein n=1 Tax=Thermodesulfobacterium sp. TA1 TaxID=2234087 RepID=UPI001232564B|nr:hypothetical protein [Thermodesulfobacterium sp. TA1]QER42713.1 hypothetical protein F1847_08145 [Thermodesulfobacterium sp. TA1]